MAVGNAPFVARVAANRKNLSDGADSALALMSEFWQVDPVRTVMLSHLGLGGSGISRCLVW